MADGHVYFLGPPGPINIYASRAEGTKLTLTWRTPTDNAYTNITKCHVEKWTKETKWGDLEEKCYRFVAPKSVLIKCKKDELCCYRVHVEYDNEEWSEPSQPTRPYRLPCGMLIFSSSIM